MMATASATTNELASNDKDGLPAPRRRAGGRRGVNNLNSSFIASSITKSTEQNSDDKLPSESAVAGDGAAPKRRTSIQSRRERGGSLGSNLSNSLNRSVTGIERTEGRLSVSFSDNRGLSASTIADILSGSGLDLDGPESESEKSAKEMMEEQEEAVEGRDHLGSLGGAASPRSRRRSRPQLQTIVSQRIMKFDSSDGSDEE